MEHTVQSHRDLKVWQRAMDLAVEITLGLITENSKMLTALRSRLVTGIANRK